ncbi:hypothetical protein [Streptomyces celluloflavus]|uniref:hypothetical protein n=1 Tax=Streptomyces celluloflavus TaxID=58344 RepID=UPI0036910B7B
MQNIDGRRYETRSELAARHHVTPRTLSTLWTHRADNHHPPAKKINGTLHWDADTYDQWLPQHWTPRRRHTADQDQAAVPAGLHGPAEFARLCGHADTSTISGWIDNPPPGFPAPNHWQPLPSGRRRPYWTTERMRPWAEADKSARPNAGRPRKPHPYAGDARLDRARHHLAQHPDTTTAQAVAHLQTDDDTATGARTWTAIVLTARKHPTPEH